MSELHTHACPECYRIVPCRLRCNIMLIPEQTEPEQTLAELPMGDTCICDGCSSRSNFAPVFEEGKQVIAADTGFVYEILDVCASGVHRMGGNRPILAADLESAIGYPEHRRTVYLDADRTPLRNYGDEPTSWEPR